MAGCIQIYKEYGYTSSIRSLTTEIYFTFTVIHADFNLPEEK